MARPLPDAWSRHRLARRVVLLVGVGALAPLILVGWASSAGLDVIAQHVAAAREAHAARAAARVAHALEDALAVLAGVPAEAASLPHAQAEPAFGEALHRARLGARELVSVFLLDARGELLAWDPGNEVPRLPEAAVAAAARGDRPVVLAAKERLVLLVPFAPSGPAAVSGAILDPNSRPWARLLDEPESAGSRVALLAADGSELTPGRIPPGQASADSAQARVAGTDLAVRVVGGDTRTLAAMARLRRLLLLAGGLAVLVALGLAWGAARSITQPLERLTREAERLMDGELDAPLPELGADEIGLLAAALESTRRALRDAFEALRGANQALEARVEERTRELAAANAALSDRDRRRADLLRKVISAQEEERRRVARELHDETGQTLASLKLLLEQGDQTDGGRARLERARTLAARGLDSLYELMFDLRPAVLDDLGLRAALRSFAMRHLEPQGLKVSCEFEPAEQRLPAEVETALFRAAQEALKNVARHAGAEHVLLEVTQDPVEVRVEIEDDGCGFDPAQLLVPSPSGRGLGLLGMRERLELIGGRAEIDSAPAQGTRVVLRAPLGGSGE